MHGDHRGGFPRSLEMLFCKFLFMFSCHQIRLVDIYLRKPDPYPSDRGHVFCFRRREKFIHEHRQLLISALWDRIALEGMERLPIFMSCTRIPMNFSDANLKRCL